MRDFVKIYSTILDSSVWGESKDVKLLWIAMLAMGGETGIVEASVGGLARRAGLTRDECEVALDVLGAPDPDDKSGVDDGRRIHKTERGWSITNHRLYRDFRTDAQVENAERQQRFRDSQPKPKKKQELALPVVTSVTSNDVTPSNASSRVEREQERDQEQERKPEIARPREEAPPPPRLAPVADHQITVKLPKNRTEALVLPISERAFHVEQNRHQAEWFQPESWPEVLEVAQAVHAANGLPGQVRLAAYARDSGVRAVVTLFATGFTLDELLAAIRGVTKSKWWRSEEGKPRGLGALTVEVIRREQAGARETALSPEQLHRIARAKAGLNPDPRRPGAGPSLVATVLPPMPAASGGDS